MSVCISVCVCVCVCESYYARFEYAALLGIITEPPKPLSKVWHLFSRPLKTTLKIDRVVPQIRSAATFFCPPSFCVRLLVGTKRQRHPLCEFESKYRSVQICTFYSRALASRVVVVFAFVAGVVWSAFEERLQSSTAWMPDPEKHPKQLQQESQKTQFLSPARPPRSRFERCGDFSRRSSTTPAYIALPFSAFEGLQREP